VISDESPALGDPEEVGVVVQPRLLETRLPAQRDERLPRTRSALEQGSAQIVGVTRIDAVG